MLQNCMYTISQRSVLWVTDTCYYRSISTGQTSEVLRSYHEYRQFQPWLEGRPTFATPRFRCWTPARRTNTAPRASVRAALALCSVGTMAFPGSMPCRSRGRLEAILMRKMAWRPDVIPTACRLSSTSTVSSSVTHSTTARERNKMASCCRVA